MAEARKLRVAVAQIHTVLGDLKANLAKHLAMIERARAARVDALLFPELSLTGHSTGPAALRLALVRDDPMVLEIARASGEMFTIFGMIEEGFAAQFYNTAAAVHDGEVVFLHRKINLATYGYLEEGKHFAGGRYVETFLLAPYWQASVLICADMWNPALIYLAALHGSTVLLAPISSAAEAMGVEFDNPGGWDVNLRFYAMTYGLPILMANRVGKEEHLTFWGGSRIIDPFGQALAKADDQEEELVTAELDYETIRKARYALPTVRDSNLSLIQREIERLAEIVGVPTSVRKP